MKNRVKSYHFEMNEFKRHLNKYSAKNIKNEKKPIIIEIPKLFNKQETSKRISFPSILLK